MASNLRQRSYLSEASVGPKTLATIKKAVEQLNYRMIGKIVDILRFKHGFKYNDTFDVFKQAVPGLTKSKFEQLMYATDTEHG